MTYQVTVIDANGNKKRAMTDEGRAKARDYQRRLRADPERVKRTRENGRRSYAKRSAEQPRAVKWKLYVQRLRGRYGLTPADVDRMLAAQDSACAVCSSAGGKDDIGRLRGLVVDHDHSTGAVRGLLCGRCNTMLAVIEAGNIADKLAGYLKAYGVSS